MSLSLFDVTEQITGTPPANDLLIYTFPQKTRVKTGLNVVEKWKFVGRVFHILSFSAAF